ncbi:hypothetical protein ACOME3_006056 [Neoechinorhynchus agilis]
MVDTVVMFTTSRREANNNKGKLLKSGEVLMTGVFWGNNANLSSFIILNETLFNWPLVTNVFSRGSLELFGAQDEDGSRPGFIVFNKNREIEIRSLANTDAVLYLKKPSAYVDYTGDLIPDLVLSLKNDKFQLWSHRPADQLIPILSYEKPKEVYHTLPSLFVDFAARGRPAHLIPVCLDKSCSQSTIMARSYGSNTKDVWIDLTVNTSGFRFIHKPGTTSTVWSAKVAEPASMLKVADVNLDGFPDILAVMADSKGLLNVIVLQNVGNAPNSFGRTFTAKKISTPFLGSENQIGLAAFFDINENGYPDLILAYNNNSKSRDLYDLSVLQNNAEEDTYFLKVTVLGSCSRYGNRDKCSTSHLPYGDNWPGSTVLVTVNTDESHSYTLFGSQMIHGNSQFALALPYVTFGLGNMPNFVENVRVASAASHENNDMTALKPYHHDWPQMIPNSHIVIVIYPPDAPSTWKTHLHVTPSKLIIYTGIALTVICVAIGILVLVLHFKEKKEDKKERKLDVRRFRYEAL